MPSSRWRRAGWDHHGECLDAVDMTRFDVPDELEVLVDGPVRVVRLNRPEQLNATNDELHRGLAGLFPQIDADDEARAVVLTGNGKAFSAGGDFTYLDELARDRSAARRRWPTAGRSSPAWWVPRADRGRGQRAAVGLGCSLVALSDIVFMAESTHLADPHVLMGLVAADGGPVTWPLMISLQLAKEYALTGDRIPAKRAAEIGLVNHVCPDDEVVAEAVACAHRIATLPRRAVEDTKRILNLHLERAILATLDFALSAEDRSFVSPELRANLDRLLAPERRTGRRTGADRRPGRRWGDRAAGRHRPFASRRKNLILLSSITGNLAGRFPCIPSSGSLSAVTEPESAADASAARTPQLARAGRGAVLDSARLRAETRVQRFLDAAIELFNSGSGKDFTVQEVVDRSGQSLRSFYQYFGGKHELLLALFEESVRSTTEYLREKIEQEDDPARPTALLRGRVLPAVPAGQEGGSGASTGGALHGRVRPAAAHRAPEGGGPGVLAAGVPVRRGPR